MNKDYVGNLKRSFRIWFDAIKDDYLNSKDPDFFIYNGTQIYTGAQGSGKTLSMVRDALRMKERFPRAKVVTNLQLSVDWADEIISFSDIGELAEVLVTINNGKYGVIYMIDEIHSYFNALDSKSIPPYVFTEISQQRKQRKVILGSSQLFMRLAKPFREQCSNMLVCKTYMGLYTTVTAYDGMELTQALDGSLIGTRKKKIGYFQSRELRDSYDTFQKVVSSNVELQQYQLQETKKKGVFKR